MTRRIVDFHAHAFPDAIAAKAANNLQDYYGLPLAADRHFSYLLDSMRENHITKMVIHATATKPSQVQNINRFIASLTNEDIYGFGTLHYAFSDLDGELARMAEMGLRGVKLHPIFQGFAIDDATMFPIYERLEGRWPILMHVGDVNSDASSPRRLARVLDRFPGLTVIAAHLGGYQEWDEAMDCLIGRDIYIDTSSSVKLLPPERSLSIIRAHGADKVLFGTDYPLSLHKEELACLDKLGLTEDEMTHILWKNAYRLLNIPE